MSINARILRWLRNWWKRGRRRLCWKEVARKVLKFWSRDPCFQWWLWPKIRSGLTLTGSIVDAYNHQNITQGIVRIGLVWGRIAVWKARPQIWALRMSFTYKLEAYQFETRKQETRLACSSQSQHKHELTTWNGHARGKWDLRMCQGRNIQYKQGSTVVAVR